MEEYQPGVCNIGPAEQSKRRTVGYLGLVAGLLVAIAVPFTDLNPMWVLASSAPFYAGFLGLLQARARFCAGFGLAGVYDITDDGGHRMDVEDATARKADRRRALVLQFQAVLLSVLAASVVYVLVLVLS